MRLAFFYRDYLGGGAYPRDTELLARALGGRVEHVFVYCYTNSRSNAVSSTEGNVTVRRYFMPKRASAFGVGYVPKELRERIVGNLDRVDVVTLIGAFIPANFPVARLAWRHGLPYAVSPGEPINAYSLHGRGVKWLRKQIYARICERFIIEHAAAVQLCSEAHFLQLLSLGFHVDRARTFVGREAIDWEDFRRQGMPRDTEASRHDEEERPTEVEGGRDAGHEAEVVFGYLGRLRPFHKGLDLLLEAWALYKQLGGRGRLELTGPGTRGDVRHLHRLCRRLRLTQVSFHPPKYGPEKYAYLDGLSALVHPSRHDGITRVVREGLAMRCVLITTYNTHVYDLLHEWDAGFATATDALDLAMTLKRFSERTPLERACMRDGAGCVARRLNWERGADDFLEGIRQTVTGRSPSEPEPA